MYKLIACDLDHTLLTTDCHVSLSDRDAIAQAAARGVKFVLCTGRGYTSVRGTLEEIGLLGRENEYVISFNGAVITENAGERVLFCDEMPFAQAEALFQRGLTYPDLCLHVYTMNDVYIWNITESELAFLDGRMDYKDLKTPDLTSLRGETILKVLYMNTDMDYLRRITEEISDLTGDVDVSYSSGRYIELNHRGVTKGSGLMRLAELLGIPQAQTMAIGDNWNDLSMIERAGLGAGVANTDPDMREKCDYIAQRNHDESAVTEILQRFVLGQA